MAKKKLLVKVLFDTNVIFNGTAHHLLKNEVFQLIKTYSSLSDINISWNIPEPVLKERIFQMSKRGNELLPNVQKLETLLGHKLNITKEIIDNRIQATVTSQVHELQLNIVPVNIGKVNWEGLIHDSIFRIP